MRSAIVFGLAIIFGAVMVLWRPWDEPSGNAALDDERERLADLRDSLMLFEQRDSASRTKLARLEREHLDSIRQLQSLRRAIVAEQRERRETVDSLIAKLPDRIRDEMQEAMDAERHSWDMERRNLLAETASLREINRELKKQLDIEIAGRGQWREQAERYRALADAERDARIAAQRESKITKIVAGVVTTTVTLLALLGGVG